MTTDFLIKQLKMQKNEDEYLHSRITKTYIPYEEKVALCKAIVNGTTHVNVDGETLYQKNTPAQFVNYALTLISRYTDIEIDFDNVLVEYNRLDEQDLINKLISIIPEREYASWNRIMQMTNDDAYDNERSIASMLEVILQMISTIADVTPEE